MITDIIMFSNDGFKCANCENKFNPGTLVNVFRWSGKVTLFCMECLQNMSIPNEDIEWVAEQVKDPRMKEKI
jgi:hypothetical protein